jgi:hypothetical protein
MRDLNQSFWWLGRLTNMISLYMTKYGLIQAHDICNGDIAGWSVKYLEYLNVKAPSYH